MAAARDGRDAWRSVAGAGHTVAASAPEPIRPGLRRSPRVATRDVEAAKSFYATVPPFDTPAGRISVVGDSQGGTFSVVAAPAAS